jgi:FkbM family methyltransferase
MSYVSGELRKLYPGQMLNVFDVGANVGHYTEIAMGVFGLLETAYHCFEPSTAAFAELKRKMSPYNCVSLHNLALSDTTERNRPFFGDKAGSSQSSLHLRRLDHYGVKVDQVETINTQTLDEFCVQNTIDRVHFLKLDVEGHELKCLQGARSMTRSGRIDFIQFEFGGTNIDARTYFQDFWYELNNYQITRIIRDGLVDIGTYRESEEMFGAQNFLACLRR